MHTFNRGGHFYRLDCMMIKFCSPLKRCVKFLICAKNKKFMGALNPNLTQKFKILDDLHYAFRTHNGQKNLKIYFNNKKTR